MIIEVIIHPSRLELVSRILSDDGEGFTIKKLSSTDISYKFGISSVEQGENYNLFKNDMDKLLSPYIADAGTIYIVPPSFFFQTKSFSCSPDNAVFEEYIQWEATCMATDIFAHYMFGYHYSEESGKMFISLVRKAVNDYFRDILNELYNGKIAFRIFSQVDSDDNSNCIQIEVNSDLRQPFSAEDETFSPVSLEDAPAGKKKKLPFAAAVLVFAVLIASFILFKTGFFTGTDTHVAELKVIEPVSDPVTEIPAVESEEQFYSDVVVAEKAEVTDIDEELTSEVVSEIDETPDEPDIAEIPVSVTQPEQEETQSEEPVSPVSEFWALNLQLLNYDSQQLNFEDGRITTSISEGNMNSIKQKFADSDYDFSSENGNLVVSHTSFVFDSFSDAQNKNSFYKVRDENYLFFSDNTYTSYIVSSEKDLTSLFRGFKQNKIEFKQFKVDRTGEKILFTPVLD